MKYRVHLNMVSNFLETVLLTRGYLHSNAAQVLRGAQSVSKQLEQRVKELEGLLKDRDVRSLSPC